MREDVTGQERLNTKIILFAEKKLVFPGAFGRKFFLSVYSNFFSTTPTLLFFFCYSLKFIMIMPTIWCLLSVESHARIVEIDFMELSGSCLTIFSNKDHIIWNQLFKNHGVGLKVIL